MADWYDHAKLNGKNVNEEAYIRGFRYRLDICGFGSRSLAPSFHRTKTKIREVKRGWSDIGMQMGYSACAIGVDGSLTPCKA